MCFAYALEQRESYPYDPPWFSKLRNAVVHEGDFVSEDEAREVGAHVYEATRTMAADLRNRRSVECGGESVAQLRDAHAKARTQARKFRKGARFSTAAMLTLLDQQLLRSDPSSFDDAFKEWAGFNAWGREDLAPVDPDAPTRIE